MSKIVINYNLKIARLRHVKSCVHEFVCLEIERKYLLEQLPEKYKKAKMSYKTTHTYYINKNKEKIKYENSAAYILMDDSKIKIKTHEETIAQFILERILEIDSKIIFLKKTIKLYCHSLNSIKLPEEITWTFKILKAATEREILASKEHSYIFEKVRLFLTGEINPKNAAELSKTNYNYFVGADNEIYRSKNEIISSICLKNCGLSYCIEPSYPQSGKRADFGIYCSFCRNDSGRFSVLKKPKQIFLEVVGINNDEKYSATLSEKVRIAKEYKIPLIIVDFSNSKDNSPQQALNENLAHSIFEFDYLSNIFTEIYFGLRKACSEKLVPYEAG